MMCVCVWFVCVCVRGVCVCGWGGVGGGECGGGDEDCAQADIPRADRYSALFGSLLLINTQLIAPNTGSHQSGSVLGWVPTLVILGSCN